MREREKVYGNEMKECVCVQETKLGERECVRETERDRGREIERREW